MIIYKISLFLQPYKETDHFQNSYQNLDKTKRNNPEGALSFS